MFPKLDPRLAVSAYYTGDNLGLHKIIHTFFGTISNKHIFYGSKWDMLTPALPVLWRAVIFVICVKEKEDRKRRCTNVRFFPKQQKFMLSGINSSYLL